VDYPTGDEENQAMFTIDLDAGKKYDLFSSFFEVGPVPYTLYVTKK